MRISTLFSCQYLILNFPHRVCTYENIDLLTIAHCFLIRYAHMGVFFFLVPVGNAEPVQRVSLCPDETRKTTLTVFFHTIFPSEGAGLSRYYRPSFSFWCGRWDLNPHVIDTRTSNVPVCRFQHFRIRQCLGIAKSILAYPPQKSKGFLGFSSNY